MISIGLTGTIGMGKSTVAGMFAQFGIPTFDADAEVRSMQGPGGSLVDRIGARFPEALSDGVLDRSALRRIVLDDPAELDALEAIVHPAVKAARALFIKQNSGAAALLFEIPLLFETGAQSQFDTVVVVSAPAEIQAARVLQRPGMTRARLDSILARQMPDVDQRAAADFVIDTGGDLSTTKRQVGAIIACLGLGGSG
ncbi:MAG: dephospho-CoA kinase [Sphingomicrobium sp.]